LAPYVNVQKEGTEIIVFNVHILVFGIKLINHVYVKIRPVKMIQVVDLRIKRLVYYHVLENTSILILVIILILGILAFYLR